MSKPYTDEIQPTMKRIVALVNRLGFETTDSGDGVLNVEAGMEHALDCPHVVAMLQPNVDHVWAAKSLSRELSKYVTREDYWVECSYSTADDTALITVMNLTDADLNERA